MYCKLPSGNSELPFLTVTSYLAISDFYSIGEEQRYSPGTDLVNISGSAEEDNSGQSSQASGKNKDERNEAVMIRMERSLSGGSADEAIQDIVSTPDSFSFKSAAAETKKRKRRTASLNLDPDLLSLASQAQKLRQTPSAKMTREREHDDVRPGSSDDQCSSVPTPNITLTQQESTRALLSPLQLSTLASVTGTSATRNKQVNILAMIEYVSISTVKPATAPLKRDVRLVDPTTDRKVTLSVFVDPVNFIPKEYDIMLFRNLTTHDFSGGNLNAYPKKCRGTEWYILNPYDIKECDMRSMEEFRTNYRKTRAQGPKRQVMKN